MKILHNFSLNKSWVFHFTLAVIHDFALYCLIIPIKNGIINASKNFMCARVCVGAKGNRTIAKSVLIKD